MVPAAVERQAETRRLKAALVVPLRRRLGEAYGVGPDLAAAVDACRRLAAFGYASTTCYTPAPDDSPHRVAAEYRAAIDASADLPPDCYLSIKPAGFGWDGRVFAELQRSARETGRRIHLDALAPEVAERSWTLLRRAAEPEWVGATLPGRWRRSLEDAECAVQLGFAVRVVKGEWPDPGDPDADVRTGFLDVIDRLAGRAPRVAVATHDVDLLEEAVRRLARSRTEHEVELLFGLPVRRPAAAARHLGAAVRIYVPYGTVGPPYRLRAAASPRVLPWFLHDVAFASGKTWREIS